MRQRVLSLYILLAYTTILAAMLSFVQADFLAPTIVFPGFLVAQGLPGTSVSNLENSVVEPCPVLTQPRVGYAHSAADG